MVGLIPGMPLGTHFPLSAPGAVLLLIADGFRRIARFLYAVGSFAVASNSLVCTQVVEFGMDLFVYNCLLGLEVVNDVIH